MNKIQIQQDVDELRKAAEVKLAAEHVSDAPVHTPEQLLHELQVHQIELEMQNENLRIAHLEMERSRDRYVQLYDFAPVGYFTLSREGLIDEANLTAASLLGVERKKLMRARFDRFIVPAERDAWYLSMLRVVRHSEDFNLDLTLQRADGTHFYAQLNCLNTSDPATGIRVTLTDVTERRRLEGIQRKQQELEEQEGVRKQLQYAYGQWVNALDVVDDAIFMYDKEFRILRCNEAYHKLAGIPFKKIIGQPYYEIFPVTHAPMSCCLQALEKGTAEEEVKFGDAIFRARAFVIHDEQDVYLYSVHILEDISERKQYEDLRLRSENLLRLVVENIPIRIFWKDSDLNYLGCNTLFAGDSGHVRPDDLIGKSDFEMVWKEQAAAYLADDLAVIGSGTPKLAYEEPGVTSDGKATLLRSSKVPLRDTNNQTIGILGIYEDITEHKLLETTLDHSNRVLMARSLVNRSMVHAHDEHELMLAVCQAIVDQRSFNMAWVGYVQHDENKSIKVMASAGLDEGYIDVAKHVWTATERGMGPSGRAVRSGKTQLCQDIAHDTSELPWRDAALAHGYAAGISLPLFDSDHTVFGILDVYAGQADAFIPAEIKLLEEMAEDMSYGVRALRTRIERDHAAATVRQQVVQLQDNLEDTIQAISTIVELRDPYTAGHQRRVADLACAIARQMGLPDEQVHGIQIAGLVHDLGKVQIPAEILSKPGKLSDIEYGLIKLHPQAGFDILKGVDFPWPIAQIVLQHHERLDGSGYPQGIKGDDILLEARILSVADVVEAMSSHRPYRAGLGVDVALPEMIRGRGVWFDPVVVDACLTLFREKKYILAP